MTDQQCTLVYTIEQMGGLMVDDSYTITLTRTHYDLAGRTQTQEHEIGQVYELNNPNPLVNLELPLGVTGLVEIIRLIQHEKNMSVPA